MSRRKANAATRLVDATERLADEVDALRFAAPVAYVYNPLRYARRPHAEYLRRFGGTSKEAVLLGMNPGPFGMAQTGVPFGDVSRVRDWMGIEAMVERPPREHPKRPVLGFECARSEVSGTRLWTWAEARFGAAEHFFSRFFVYNYCPLAFLDEGGRNLTPDKLPRAERDALHAVCDRALIEIVGALEPRWVIGVGAFAERCARRSLDEEVQIGSILHPSPASPRANRGWAEQAEAELQALGIALPAILPR